MEFKAELIDGELEVKPIIEKKGEDVIVHMPSYPLIQKLKDKLTQDGIRNI